MIVKYKNLQNDDIEILWDGSTHSLKKKNITTGKVVLYTGIASNEAYEMIENIMKKDIPCDIEFKKEGTKN